MITVHKLIVIIDVHSVPCLEAIKCSKLINLLNSIKDVLLSASCQSRSRSVGSLFEPRLTCPNPSISCLRPLLSWPLSQSLLMKRQLGVSEASVLLKQLEMPPASIRTVQIRQNTTKPAHAK